MIFELINPSDAYILQSDSYAVAAVANLVVGPGTYGLQEIKGRWVMPIAIFPGVLDKWVKENFNQDVEPFIKNVLDNQRQELIECLESFFIGSISDKELYDAALALIPNEADKITYRETYHDKKRSSMNDIGARARKMAEALRKPKVEAV